MLVVDPHFCADDDTSHDLVWVCVCVCVYSYIYHWKCQIIVYAKKPLKITLFCRKWSIKTRHSTHLRHPVTVSASECMCTHVPSDKNTRGKNQNCCGCWNDCSEFLKLYITIWRVDFPDARWTTDQTYSALSHTTFVSVKIVKTWKWFNRCLNFSSSWLIT